MNKLIDTALNPDFHSELPTDVSLNVAPSRSDQRSPDLLHQELWNIEEKLEQLQGSIRDILLEERRGGSYQPRLDALARMLGEWEMIAIRTQFELDHAQEANLPEFSLRPNVIVTARSDPAEKDRATKSSAWTRFLGK